MGIDLNDVVLIGIRSGEKLPVANSSPIVVGTLPDGRPSYLFLWYDKDDNHFYGAGPSREESQFLATGSGGKQSLRRPAPDDEVNFLTLRFKEESFARCEYYANRKRTTSGLDWTGPFCWEFNSYLNAPGSPDRKLTAEYDSDESGTIEEGPEGTGGDEDEGVENAGS